MLGAHTKLYDTVFDKAQERLRDVFGMEMAELTSKGRSGKNEEKGTAWLSLPEYAESDASTASESN